MHFFENLNIKQPEEREKEDDPRPGLPIIRPPRTEVKAPKISDRHPDGEHCPAKPPLQKGTVVARVFGRALDKDGKPVADTLRQENYNTRP